MDQGWAQDAVTVADVLAALSDDSVSSILNEDGSTLVNENFTVYGDRKIPPRGVVRPAVMICHSALVSPVRTIHGSRH